MYKFLILLSSLLLSFCSPPPIPRPDSTSADPPVETPAQTPETQIAGQPAATNDSTSKGGEQMPVFLEVVQTTVLSKSDVQGPVIAVGPSLYFFDPDHNVLALNQNVTLAPDTKLLIGVNEVLQTPDQVFEKKEIFQNPPAQPALIQVVAHDRTNGMLTIVFAGEQFDLAPGETRTFKQQITNSSATVTIISNYGEPKEIQPILYDGSLR